ncbi:MAG: ABC transporter ATP-binding protein [Eubacterium sp.]|nr:ABC transporter ATP-binding protein [Eubacterium sp.]
MSAGIVSVENVSLKFKLQQNRADTLKEFFVRWLKKDLGSESFWALRNVSFEVKQGDVIGIIGRNGAGKSTLLKVISGIMKPTSGSILVHGNVVPMLELGSGFDNELSGRENVYLNGAILGYSKQFLESRYDEILEFSQLGSFIEAPIRTYSSGMLARLAFSIACLVEPEILIVDEILSVGDAGFQEKSRSRMLELMSGGTTVFFVSHDMDQMQEMCHKVLWLEQGEVKSYGPCEKVIDEYKRFSGGM